MLSLSCGPYVAEAPGLPETSRARLLLTGVRDLAIEVYDGRQWKTTAAGSLDQRPPRAVRLALTVVDEKNRSHAFKTMVPLGCYSAPVPPQTSVPASLPR